jgi:hypothetical protein
LSALEHGEVFHHAKAMSSDFALQCSLYLYSCGMGKYINDKFTPLNGTKSRQRIYQMRNIARGCCMVCGKPAATSILCLEHAVKKREQMRVRRWCGKRMNSLTYRLEKELQKTLDKQPETREIDAHGHQTGTAVAEQKDSTACDGDVGLSEEHLVPEPGRAEAAEQVA